MTPIPLDSPARRLLGLALVSAGVGFAGVLSLLGAAMALLR